MKIISLFASLILLSSVIVTVLPEQDANAFPFKSKYNTPGSDIPEVINLLATYDKNKKSLQVTWDLLKIEKGACMLQIEILNHPNVFEPPKTLFFDLPFCDTRQITIDMKEYDEYENISFFLNMFFSHDSSAPWQLLIHRGTGTEGSNSHFSPKCIEKFNPDQIVTTVQLSTGSGTPPLQRTSKDFTITNNNGIWLFDSSKNSFRLLTVDHPSPDVSIRDSIHKKIKEVFTNFLINPFNCEFLTPPQSCDDCVPPTLGMSHDGKKRLVDSGFIYNDKKIQVNKWFTPFPLITATVGEINTVQIKVFENFGISNMELVQFGLGAQYKGQPLNELEVLIEVHLLTDGTTRGIKVGDIVIHDTDNLIENDSVTAVAYAVKCQYMDITKECTQIDLEYSYREFTINNMMIVSVSDKTKNTQNFHFNKGVQVIGDSLNEPPTHIMFNKQANQQTENLFLTLTRTDKVNDIWTDLNNDVEYHKSSNDQYYRITPGEPWECSDLPLDEVMVPTRANCNFRELSPLWQQ